MHIGDLIDIVLDLEVHLARAVRTHGFWAFVLVSVILFLESSFLPFLPGDTLILVAGIVAASVLMSAHGLAILLFVAAVTGMIFSYALGARLGRALFRKPRRFPRPDHLQKAKHFYEAHGGWAVFAARFIPMARALVPLVAGMARMNYRHFMFYNVAGAAVWVGLFFYGGYFFGQFAIVQEHLSLFVLGVLIVSFLPFVWRVMRNRPAAPERF